MSQTRVRSHPRDDSELVARLIPYFASYLPALRRPPSLEQARQGLAQRHRERAAVFLAELRQQVYCRPNHPYARLLSAAGCSYGDLVRLVNSEGLEGALGVLLRQGVYLTEPELKGRRPVVRGSVSFHTRYRDLRRVGYFVRGLDGRRESRYGAMFRELAESSLLSLEPWGGLRWRHAHWGNLSDPMLVAHLIHTGAGCEMVRWYSRLDPRSRFTPLSGRLVARFLRPVAGLAGVKMAPLSFVPTERPEPIVDWLRSELAAGATPHLYALVSMALAVVERAQQLGVDLRGARLGVTGEPITAPRREFLDASGAEVIPSYGSKEAGPTAFACQQPAGPDDVHLYDDSYALIQRGFEQPIDDHPPEALYLTTLRPSWPYLLLNASLADRADLLPAGCGCPLEALGWRTRLRSVRSFGRLKLGQLNIPDDLLIAVLEQQLPAWFGGRAGDYQLIEDQVQVEGKPRLRLLVAETVSAEPSLIRQRFLDTMLDLGAPLRQLSSDQRWLVVERGTALLTSGSKLYPIHHAGIGPDEVARV